MNDQARDILLISIETGCRQNEIYNLPASAIQLHDPIPHLHVANKHSDDPEERREIKNLPSHRRIPLIGVALAAVQRHPEGFMRYAPRLIYAQDLDPGAVQPVPIGVNCYLCERPDCPSRAYPPINRSFSFSECARGVSSFSFTPERKCLCRLKPDDPFEANQRCAQRIESGPQSTPEN